MIKVRIQLQGEGSAAAINSNPLSVAKTIIAEDGITGLYRGLSAGILRQLTYGMTRLGIFQGLSEKFKPEGKTAADLPLSTKLGCSICAGGIGALVGTPADAALVRMQADSTLPLEQRRGYKNGLDAMIRMASEEGITGFFSGATPTILRGLAINIGMLTTYSNYKKMMAPYFGYDSQTNRFVCGALSGWTAATVSLPFDFVKTRLQKQRPDANGKLPYAGVADCIGKVMAQEGLFAFYKGYGTYCIRITPHIMLTWVFMDNVKAFLKSNNLM
eukprot:CAMPEP_0184488254 /NCGR_PEP_ID=MMETSP0113_2-20130426/10622_1 /TAXON_ID=91329 /ORGANISM="Norrisiella sphaerica, Strain BC52" /LENGTH=272 /DNA_ID=CAMNT_0026870769 /DNA_START=134 /DNA_END=952 /DNA_ORIENTATION=+